MFGKSPPTTMLLEHPYISKWYQVAKNIHKNNPTLKDYLDSADTLKRSILASEISEVPSDSEPDLL
jgi:hypothetical protein